MEVRINRDVLDEILFDQGISRQRLTALKIKLKEGRGPFVPFLNRLCTRNKWRDLGVYYPPKGEKGEVITLYPEEIERIEEKSLSGILAHECGHAIIGPEKLNIHPFLVIAYLLPPSWEPFLFLTGLLSLLMGFIRPGLRGGSVGIAEMALLVIGASLLVFVRALPTICVKGYFASLDEVLAHERAAKLLEDPRWEQVVSSDS